MIRQLIELVEIETERKAPVLKLAEEDVVAELEDLFQLLAGVDGLNDEVALFKIESGFWFEGPEYLPDR